MTSRITLPIVLSYIILTLIPNLLLGQAASVTQGIGTTTQSNLLPNCPSNHITPLGIINSSDGKVWDVPASVNYNSNYFLPDLYNSCNNIIPSDIAGVDLSNLPIHVLDSLGDTITAHLFCDNYFELYINGILIGVDAIPFTPFNSSIARFKVSKPYTISVKLVDWEENLGLGSEIQSTTNYHPGDGGFVAKFSDGTQTDSTWKAQVFYIAPLENPSSVVETENHIRSTANATNSPTCDGNCYGLHFPIDTNWMKRDFNDETWPNAFLYSASQVTNQPAYTNFASTCWLNTPFIWTSNLILDNVVLARKTVTGIEGLKTEIKKSVFLKPEIIGNDIIIKNLQFQKKLNFTLIDAQGKTIQEWKYNNIEPNEVVSLSLPPMNTTHSIMFLRIETMNSTESFKLNK